MKKFFVALALGIALAVSLCVVFAPHKNNVEEINNQRHIMAVAKVYSEHGPFYTVKPKSTVNQVVTVYGVYDMNGDLYSTIKFV